MDHERLVAPTADAAEKYIRTEVRKREFHLKFVNPLREKLSSRLPNLILALSMAGAVIGVLLTPDGKDISSGRKIVIQTTTPTAGRIDLITSLPPFALPVPAPEPSVRPMLTLGR